MVLHGFRVGKEVAAGILSKRPAARSWAAGRSFFRWVHRSPVVPPVPIPNTEVKPSRADGTARFPCGRVGRCRNIIETPRRPILGRGAFLFPVGSSVASRPTRSHPEHGSQALQSRWYCTVSVWESRSLPEYYRNAPPPDPGPRGVPFSGGFIGRQSSHPFPSRTRKSSPPEPMVLHGFRVGE